jgi:hypothetical protein
VYPSTLSIPIDPIQLKHAVAHGALNALIGVHGSQLTESLFMKTGSLLVEFLPYRSFRNVIILNIQDCE